MTTMNITYPIALSHDEIWLFLENSNPPHIEACRLALYEPARKFIACPVEDVITDGIVPIDRNTGMIVDGCVWANTHDLADNPLYPDWLHRQGPPCD